MTAVIDFTNVGINHKSKKRKNQEIQEKIETKIAIPKIRNRKTRSSSKSTENKEKIKQKKEASKSIAKLAKVK